MSAHPQIRAIPPHLLPPSAITWTGFDNFYYLFSYTDTKDAFNIPHDLKILKVWQLASSIITISAS